MKRRFVTLDVFTSRRFAGNPLAVVLEPDGLDQAAMQAIAREFNLPETVFVFDGDASVRAGLRIFTPATELPFAGHPTVGAAVLLALRDGGAEKREITLQQALGPVRCIVAPRGDGGYARFAVPKLPQRTARAPDLGAIAAALHLETSDIGFDGFRPAEWSAGVPFHFVPVRDLKPLARCKPDLGLFDSVFGATGPGKAYIFCRKTVDARHAFHARMFAPGLGIPEDPATGSAAAAFAGLLAQHGHLGDGEHRVSIEQGIEMGRPSVIELGMTIRNGALTAATIGGEALIVSEGTIEV